MGWTPRDAIEGYGSFTAYEANIWKYLITTFGKSTKLIS